MPDLKVSAMTELTDPALADLIYMVDDPSGTPVSRKATVQALLSTLRQAWTCIVPVNGISANTFEITGELREITSGETATWNSGGSGGNQHVYLYVNSLTGSGSVTITGTSVSESTAVPVASDTESITVDASSQYYQTDKKWLEIDSVTIPGGISAINYDIGVVGYLDMGNRNFTIVGYRAEFLTTSNLADMRLRIRKVQDDGSKKMSLPVIEDYGFDSTVGNGQYYDHIRTGGDDRSYTMGETLAPSDSMIVFKMLDFNTYFSSDENILEGADKAEGIIIDFLGEPSGGINAVDHCTLTLYYTFNGT